MTNGNEPINAFFETNENGYGQAITFYSPDGSKQILPYQSGLTKREYFAAMAMQGMLASGRNDTSKEGIRFIYETSIIHADALIKELNKTNENKS